MADGRWPMADGRWPNWNAGNPSFAIRHPSSAIIHFPLEIILVTQASCRALATGGLVVALLANAGCSTKDASAEKPRASSPAEVKKSALAVGAGKEVFSGWP